MITNERTALYRLYDKDRQLLYVGITNDPDRRFAQHAADKDWWESVAHRDIEWFGSRAGALSAEEAAIKSHAPSGNRQHSPDWPHIRVTVEVSDNVLRGLDLLIGLLPAPTTLSREQTRDMALWMLLTRELAARGLTGEPRCLHNAGMPWPDGLVIENGVGEPCSCGYILGPGGSYEGRGECRLSTRTAAPTWRGSHE